MDLRTILEAAIAALLVAVAYLLWLSRLLPTLGRRGGFRVRVYPFRAKGISAMKVIVPSNMIATIALDAIDEATGEVVPVDGAIQAVVADPSVAAMTPLANPNEFDVESLGTTGQMTVADLSADARIGEGVRTISGQLEIEVGSAEASGFGLRVLALRPRA